MGRVHENIWFVLTYNCDYYDVLGVCKNDADSSLLKIMFRVLWLKFTNNDFYNVWISRNEIKILKI